MFKKSLCVAFLGFLLVPTMAFSDSTAGKVRSKLGDVNRQKENQQTWKPLSVGASVFMSDRVRTGTESEVVFGLPDGSVVSIAENAEMVIADLFEKDGVFRAKLDIKKGHVGFDVKKLSDKSSFEFKTGTATAAIRGTKGFIGGEKGFVGSLKEGKLEITSTKSGRKFSIGAGETALGRDSLVVLKLATSGSPSLAKALAKVTEDSTLTIDQIVEAAKVADSTVASKENAPLDEESMKVTSVSSEVCSGGLKIEGSYRTAVSTASLVVKAGTYVSENLATSTDGKTHTFSVSVPVTDENKLWTLTSADVVLTAGEKVVSETVSYTADKSCAEVNTRPAQIRFSNYDSLRCVANVAISGLEDDAAIFSVDVDGTPKTHESLTRNALKRAKLSEGVHDYVFSVVDMAKNRAELKKKLGCFPPRKFNVQILGKKSEVVPNPPGTPNGYDKIVKTVQFTVRVPGGDPSVLYKVVVKQNSRIILEESLNQIQTLDYQVPVELVRKGVNKIEVEVTHKSGYIVKAQKVYEVF
jgi:hypothetical protein